MYCVVIYKRWCKVFGDIQSRGKLCYFCNRIAYKKKTAKNNTELALYPPDYQSENRSQQTAKCLISTDSHRYAKKSIKIN